LHAASTARSPLRLARGGFTLARRSPDPVERYWALSACSCFGEEAASFEPSARGLLSDKNLLVRTRAAEFLALIGKADPTETLMQCLKQSESGIQTNLILNTAVLLRDGKPGYDINITADDVHPEAAKFQDVRRRLAYFAAEDGIPQNPRGVQSKKRKK